MKTKSTITRPPPLPEIGQEIGGNLALSDDEERQAALLKLIRKGAPSVAPTAKERATKRAVLFVRLEQQVIDRVKAAAKGHRLHIPANTWVVEAVLEKLAKEGF